MTDDNVRPETDPSRDPESLRPEEQGVDDVTDIVEPFSSTVEPAEAPDEVSAAEPASAEDVDADVTVAQAADTGAPLDTELSAATEREPVGEPEPVAESEQAAEPELVAKSDQAAEPEPVVVADQAAESRLAAEPESPVEAVTEDEPVAGPTEPAAAPEPAAVAAATRDDAFTWHPEHKGKTFDEVRAALAQDIAADQRQHRLAMDGAEESEQEALASVVSLERKWGPYDFDWAEQEPEELADRILDFERERERRQEMISWSDYRNAGIETDEVHVAGERAPELSTPAKGLSLLLVVLLIVVILLAVWAL